MKDSVIIVSGGMDSITLLHLSLIHILNQAAKNLAEGMRGTVSDYEVASIVKTPIVDAYKIAEK